MRNIIEEGFHRLAARGRVGEDAGAEQSHAASSVWEQVESVKSSLKLLQLKKGFAALTLSTPPGTCWVSVAAAVVGEVVGYWRGGHSDQGGEEEGSGGGGRPH